MIGTKLAHYEITSHLGSGGMGDVYQATDSKLGRSVAIKLLPEPFARDAERVARFEREARVLASLNHPNIAAIYGIEQSGDRKFLVMELAGGETLAERIKRGPIPVDESLGIAKQICEALETAHEKGVVHRDLKPANVKIAPDGRVKVLDFGLAKAFENQQANAALSNSPTLSMAATNAGVILGTAAYMSPEQAKGRPVDKRADIFAFGCVLFEMLTGRPAFEGEDVTDILSAVVRMEPDWTRLPAGVPPGVRKLLRLCLEKDVTKRRRDAGDVRIDTEQALTEPVAAMPAVTRTRSTSLAWIVAAAAVLVALVLAIPSVRYLRETPLPETRLNIATQATSDPVSFALSPDGRQFVYVASVDGASGLWLRPLDKATAQRLAGTEGASYPFWSPDSRSVGFFSARKLKRVDIGGGLPQTLATVAASARGGTWSPDGVILFAPSTSGPLFRIPASGGEATAITKLAPRQTGHRFPQFLPGGRQFLFYSWGENGIYMGSLDVPDIRRLTAAATAGFYAPSGWLLFVSGGTLVARRFDPARGELTGDQVTLADQVGVDVISASFGAFSVSAAGQIAYRSGGGSRRQLEWFDRMGKALGTMGPPDENGLSFPRLSPDDRRVAAFRTVQGNTDVWILDGTRTSRFTFDAAIDGYPAWSPDGSQIIFGSDRKGTRNLYVKPSSGAGIDELLLESGQPLQAANWSADGRFISYSSADPQTARDLWVLPMNGASGSSTRSASRPARSQEKVEGDRKPWVFLKTDFDEHNSQFSADGRWVAYMSSESGRSEIYVRPFVAPAATTANGISGQWQVSTTGGIYPRWRPDGKELYYIGPDGQMMAAPITVTGDTLEPGAPVALFQSRILGGGEDNDQGRQYDVSRDGRFLINTVLDDAASPITLIQNWKPPAK